MTDLYGIARFAQSYDPPDDDHTDQVYCHTHEQWVDIEDLAEHEASHEGTPDDYFDY